MNPFEPVLGAEWHNALQNALRSIEERGRSLKKQALLFPVSKGGMIEDLKALKEKIERLIAGLETLDE